LAGYYAWRQVKTLRGLRSAEETGPEERLFLLRQARRRIFGSALMVLLALMLGGMLIFLEGPLEELSNYFADARAAGVVDPDLSPEQKSLRTLYTVWTIGLLLTLLAVLATAGVDFLATRRFSMRQLRRIQSDRRAMIERQVARLRQEGNGHP
jgi:Kef-type K+ transport system membrane component KefB